MNTFTHLLTQPQEVRGERKILGQTTDRPLTALLQTLDTGTQTGDTGSAPKR